MSAAYFGICLLLRLGVSGGLVLCGLAGLEQRQVVSVGIGEVCADAVRCFDQGVVLESHTARLQRFEIPAAVVGGEDVVVAAAVGFRSRAGDPLSTCPQRG